MMSETTQSTMNSPSAVPSTFEGHSSRNVIPTNNHRNLYPSITTTTPFPDLHCRPMSISSTTQLIPTTDLSPIRSDHHQFINRSQSNFLELYTSHSRTESSQQLIQPCNDRDIRNMPAFGRCHSVMVGHVMAPIDTRNLNAGITVQPTRNNTTIPSSRTCSTLPDNRTPHLPEYTPPLRSNTSPPHASRRSHHNHHTSVHTQTSHTPRQQETCKEPCLKCLSAVTSFKCLLVSLSLVGVLCVVTGIVLGALHAVSGSYLFLSIMFLALGVVLVIVVFVGWKCTPRGHEPCHILMGLGNHTRRRSRSSHTRRNRDGNWYGGVLYPEFRHRRPPPTYTASMQDYHQRLMQAQQQYLSTIIPVSGVAGSQPSSPPPTYCSHASTTHPGLQVTFSGVENSPNSRPPTYRSHISTTSSRPVLPIHDDTVQIHNIDTQRSNTAVQGATRLDTPPQSASNRTPSTVIRTPSAVRNETVINVNNIISHEAIHLALSNHLHNEMTQTTSSHTPHVTTTTHVTTAPQTPHTTTRVTTSPQPPHTDSSNYTNLAFADSSMNTYSDDSSQSDCATVDCASHDVCIETLLASTLRTFDEITMNNTVLNTDYNTNL